MDLLEWLMDFGPSSPIMDEGKVKDLVVVQSTRLDVSAIPVWCWSPTEALESGHFSLHWNPEEVGSNSSEGIAQGQDRRTCP